jgi:uncharacterized protein (DUF3084 family)
MRQLNLYLIQLLLINWTASFAQHGVSKDTSRCYGLTELRKIAKTAVDLNTCDTLLSNSKKMLANRDTLIKEKDYTITQYSLTVGIKDQIIKNREDTLAVRDKKIKKLHNQKKAILVGWAATAILEAALIIYFMIH